MHPLPCRFRVFLRDKQGLVSESRILVLPPWETAILHPSFLQLLFCPLIVRIHLERELVVVDGSSLSPRCS